MDKGLLVPDDIVIGLIQKRMSADDVKRKGWILDGFPRTGAQAMALEKASIKPNAVLLLEVALDVLVKRTINRRLDPITDKIYHLEHDREILERDEELKKRLIARSDDTEEKCKLRFETFNENAESVLGCYKEICYPLDGAKHREETFEVISKIIDKLL
ncbi:hypothetical protein MHBO_004911 [Bonamia ostreae]|uniref:Adenylate kinase n=1 Tax=Bonamia ostreae TaxID=126728 RepID=A0ABV2AVB9_9EUKA